MLSCRVSHPENRPPLVSGQKVKVTLLPQEIEIQDFYWSDEDYRFFAEKAGFKHLKTQLPLGRKEDSIPWRDEIDYPPFAVYHFRKP
jgi:hypothetical protein